jgi:predicted site-specific integrase-resolvase
MNKKEGIKSDITFIEACKLLKKSKRTISRYIKNGLLNPDKIKSKKGMILLN